MVEIYRDQFLINRRSHDKTQRINPFTSSSWQSIATRQTSEATRWENFAGMGKEKGAQWEVYRNSYDVFESNPGKAQFHAS
ncbi:hypothetical protein PAAG_06757 [Paracoccidioides lutzii Pb01]|uniref:Uncharacterized protein n=1 Tax=Paracoccidioides lutzii (strain ATCC MYA-826 / Pb01) TaxID=502779 RepID=C1H7L6_PARBA|nr:hypothetical protein PAAG_06757 [Paracoccidioides lutzii Pb01]EEH36339.2 hypothetical protein PAAG_06757 [Paracoccidioides lutzii Pb01]